MDLTFGPGLILVEGTILVSFLLLLFFTQRRMEQIFSRRGWKPSLGKRIFAPDWGKVEKWAKEAEALSQTFSQNLEEKKEIMERLTRDLEEKIRRWEKFSPQGGPPFSPAQADLPPQDSREPILEMARCGAAVPEIAKHLGLSKEEVQIILDLKKIHTN